MVKLFTQFKLPNISNILFLQQPLLNSDILTRDTSLHLQVSGSKCCVPIKTAGMSRIFGTAELSIMPGTGHDQRQFEQCAIVFCQVCSSSAWKRMHIWTIINPLGVVYNYRTFLKIRTMIGLVEALDEFR